MLFTYFTERAQGHKQSTKEVVRASPSSTATARASPPHEIHAQWREREQEADKSTVSVRLYAIGDEVSDHTVELGYRMSFEGRHGRWFEGTNKVSQIVPG